MNRTIDSPNKIGEDFLSYSSLKGNKKTTRIIDYENERREKPALLHWEQGIYEKKQE